MKALVIGGTTFFGKAIVEHLLADGHEVSVFSRGQQQPDFFKNVNHIQGDRSVDFADKLSDQEFDAVIDNIAYTGADVEQALDVFQGNVGRYIFTSSAAMYYTGSMTGPLDEADVNFDFKPSEDEKDSPLWTYTMGKLEGERALFSQDKMPFVIIRPPVVLGPEDVTLRGYFYFQRLMDGKPLMLTNGGVQSFRLVYSQDLAKGYLLTLSNDKALGQAYNIVQKEAIRLIDLINTSAEALGVEPDLVNVGADLFKQKEFSYPESYANMTNLTPTIYKAEADLGYTTTPYKEWLAETAIWYRDSYEGKDSAGYEQRDAEVEFVKWFRSLR
jgi:2'-hydroxyisoflavone reductase